LKFTPLDLEGVYVVDVDRIEDERGFFARSWCRREFEQAGLDPNLVQCNLSFNPRKGTLRGMHFQAPPHEESKLVRCTMGAVHDVIVDVRANSGTRGKWVAVELTGQNRRMLYIPKGFAHGFQTLCDDTEVFYQMSEFFFPEAARGLRWDDPVLGISWPDAGRIVSTKDRSYDDFVL
jgi:dTDP-4-dehydrorhamnose 3,5-epimerase